MCSVLTDLVCQEDNQEGRVGRDSEQGSSLIAMDPTFGEPGPFRGGPDDTWRAYGFFFLILDNFLLFLLLNN